MIDNPSGNASPAMHQACIYYSDDDFLAMALPFIREGLEADEPVLVATTSTNLALLGSEIDEVDYAETGYFGRYPHQRVNAFRDYYQRQASGGATVRMIAEPVWSGRSQRDTLAWRRMESGMNVILAGAQVRMICPYDARTLPAEALTAARRTHPSMVEAMRVTPSDDYVDPELFAQACDAEPQTVPPADAATLAVNELTEVREFIATHTTRCRFTDYRTKLAVTAVHETTAYLQSLPCHITLRVWQEFGSFVCELQGRGSGPSDPFAGFRAPALSGATSHAEDRLWLARQLCTHLDMRSTPTGCTVRLYFPTDRDEELFLPPGAT